jgi:hypothetical protein
MNATSFCRLDEPLLERIRTGRDARLVVLSAVRAIVIGAGAYGVAFGIWRAPEQAAFSAVKLPALMLGVCLGTVAISAMLAMLLRSKLSLRQTAMCMILSLAATSTVLGALAPVSIVVDLVVAPRTSGAGHALLLLHTAMIAAAGVAGVVRLRSLLARLGLEPTIARRVLVSWIGAQFLVGSQLCWLLRPFFGDLGAAPTFFARGVLRGNFFDAVAVLGRSTFGAAAPGVLVAALAILVVMLASALRKDATSVSVELGPGGLAVLGGAPRFLSWSDVDSVRTICAFVLVELVPDEALERETLRVPCANEHAARDLARHIDEARLSVGLGPFRTA